MPTLSIALFLSAVLVLGAAGPFRFEVSRKKLLRDEQGTLEINGTGFHYRSADKKTSLAFPFADIYQTDLSDRRHITIETYDVEKKRLGRRRLLTFRLVGGTHTEELARFLAESVKRPVLGGYALPRIGAVQIPAYRREFLSGTHGTLIIGRAGIEFVPVKGSYRTWLYRDIETIGSVDPFHFRITTFFETSTFDLKERLPEDAYRLAWKQVYEPERGTALTDTRE
jgi:hypothetical protein